MPHKILLLLSFCICTLCSNAQGDGSSSESNKGIYNIKTYGAVSNLEFTCTDAIQMAIDKCSDNGGGTVLVPPGNYVTGTLKLKSNVNLSLSAGAVLHASKNIKDYKILEGLKNDFYKEGVKAIINCINAYNVSITGSGEINLHAEAFVDYTKPPVFDTPVDSFQKKQGVLVMKERPNQLIFFNNCKKVSVTGIKITNAPSMTLVVSDCSVVNVEGIFIDNESMNIPNSDGIHLSGCKDVTVSNCKIFSGDDCVAITGLVNYNTLSENILISNCVMRSSSAGVRIGYLKSKIQSVILSHLIITNSNRGIIISAGKDGYVKNVNVDDCIIETQIKVGRWWGDGEAIAMFKDDVVDANGKYITTDTTNIYLQNIAFSNIQATSENGVHIKAARNNINNVFFNNCNFTLVDSYNRNIAGSFYDIQPAGYAPRKKGTLAAIYAEGINNLFLNNVVVFNGLQKQRRLNINTQWVNCLVRKNDVKYVE